MSDVKSWSATAASNNAAAPNGFPENMAYSAVNNAAREVMASVARWHDDFDGELVTGGSSNAYTLAPNVTYSAYEAGMSFLLLANHANTSTATLNISSLGAKDMRDEQGVALLAGDIAARQLLLVVYDATNGYFRCIGLRRSTAGAFTPTAIGTTTAGTPTYTAQVGRYTRVGNRCFFDITVAWSAHDGVGNIRIGGLPFTCANVTDYYPCPGIRISGLTFTGQVQAVVIANATYISLRQSSTNTAEAAIALEAAVEISLSGSYEIA